MEAKNITAWEDTVLSYEKVKEAIPIETLNLINQKMGKDADVLGAALYVNNRNQAEATWPVAYQAGIRKVVEWIREESGLDVDDETSELNGMRSIDDDDWQAKVKEWGIEGET